MKGNRDLLYGLFVFIFIFVVTATPASSLIAHSLGAYGSIALYLGNFSLLIILGVVALIRLLSKKGSASDTNRWPLFIIVTLFGFFCLVLLVIGILFANG